MKELWIKLNLKALVKYMTKKELMIYSVGAARKSYIIRHVKGKWYVQLMRYESDHVVGNKDFVTDDGPIETVVQKLYDYVK